MDKSALTRSIILQLEAELALQTEAAHGSREEATDEESKAEDRFDMRSQSAAYLAAGQARLASEIAGAIAAWSALTPRAFGPADRIGAGALVTLEAGGRETAYLMGPQSGGLEARDGESVAIVVTGSSPLGRQLIGRGVGDMVQIAGRLGPVVHRVAAVA
jgi:transcription elongation GreA/GreB family factor